MRKKKPAEPVAAVVRPAPDVKPLLVKDATACMSPPNHNVRLIPGWRQPFPLLGIVAEHPDHPGMRVPVFRDLCYGEPFIDYLENDSVPPTWFDPVVFAKMARQNPEVMAVLETCSKNNSQNNGLRRLPKLLEGVLIDSYIPYMMAKFQESVGFLGEWLMLNHVARKLAKEEIDVLNKDAAKERRRRGFTADEGLTDAQEALEE